MATTQIFKGNLPIGTRAIPSTVVPLGITSAAIALDRTTWTDPTSKVQAVLEGSLDGGATWKSVGTFTAQGGVVKNPAGVTATISTAQFFMPQPSNANRRVRGSVVVSGKAFATTISLTLA